MVASIASLSGAWEARPASTACRRDGELTVGGFEGVRRLVLVPFVLAGFWIGACSPDDIGSSAGSAVSTMPVSDGRTGEVSIPPTVLAAPTSAEAVQIVANLVRSDGPFRGLSGEEQVCLEARLDADPSLRDGLGAEPGTSPRIGEVQALREGCTQDTVLASEFAQAAARAYRNVSSEELACLRDGFAALSADELDALYRSGVTPGSVKDAPDVATGCGLSDDRKAVG